MAMRRHSLPAFALSVILVAVFAGAEACGPSSARATSSADTVDSRAESKRWAADSVDASDYEGHDSRGIPHYAARTFTTEEASLLRSAYGIEEPHRLYVSDSTEDGLLKYDTQEKRCRTCYVDSYIVGFPSVRRRGETWEQAERRVRSTPARALTGGEHRGSTSTADLDPEARPLAEKMLADARSAGFTVHVVATYRSPLREAFLMAKGGGRTYTLTSTHSYGRALDVVVDDGRLRRPQTKADWIAFRRWVTQYRTATGDSFRVLGAVDNTWDWPHLELPTEHMGFRTIEAALERARACLAPGSSTPCDFTPNLPPQLSASR
jgi:hypothetical protein